MRVAQNIFQSFVTFPSLTLYIECICQSHWFYLQNMFRIQLPLIISTATIQAPLDYCKKGSSLGWAHCFDLSLHTVLPTWQLEWSFYSVKSCHFSTQNLTLMQNEVKSPMMTCGVLPDWALHLLSDFISYCSSFASSAPSTVAAWCSVKSWVCSRPRALALVIPSVCKVLPANICTVCSLTSFTPLIKVSCQWGLLSSPFLEL